MGSDPKFVPLLVGIGLRQFSVTPQSIPSIKELIRNLTLSDAEEIARHASQLELARDIESYLRGEVRRFLPDGQQ
jgi:phosphotransferase system enzyme I (PtsI)